MRAVFDVETDGLLPELTKIHILTIKDPDSSQRYVFRRNDTEDTIQHGLDKLLSYDEIIGHNILGFDLQAIEKVYPNFEYDRSTVRDTLVLSKLYFGSIMDKDVKDERIPKQLYGRQSIEAWGHRLGLHKVGTDITDWSTWTPYMEKRCLSDVDVNIALLKHIEKLVPWPLAEQLEHDAAWLCNQIERNGIPFDVKSAVELYALLSEQREALANELKDLFPPWVVYQGEITSKANNKKTGHTIGAIYSKVLLQEFNPRSRDHIADRLKAKYKWQPNVFTKGKKPKPQIDEKVLSSLVYPEAKALAELFLIQKRIDQLAEGNEAWLRAEKKGFIYHRINPNGAVTGRATHSKPNISQVPRVGSPYGKECRSLFGLHQKPMQAAGLLPRWNEGVLFGSDVAGLELRCLAHFMSRHDGGAYGHAVVEGTEREGTDVHSLTCRAMGLEPQRVYTISGRQQSGRDCAKRFIYGYLYGAGDEKIGTVVGKNAVEGRKLKNRFLEQTPALKALREDVERACKRGYLRALDGRHVHVRSAHSALNTLLQGAGALICKAWIVELERLMLADSLRHGWDGDFAFLIWAHDEIQIACRTPYVAALADHHSKTAIKNVEKTFGIQLPLDCSGKTGRTWAETH